MSVLYVVIPLALLLAGAFLAAFVWAAKSGQFDDVDTPAHRILNDDADDVVRRGPGTSPGGLTSSQSANGGTP